MTKTAAAANVVNGVNLDQLAGTVGVIKQQPELARFQFRAKNEWLGGGHSRTTIQGFSGAGGEDGSRATPFILEGDEPPVLLGQNAGPNAVEALLHALASCLAVGIAYNAAAQGIVLRRLELALEGDLDLQGFLGLSDRIRPGYEAIRISCRVEADAPREKVEALVAYVEQTSPLLDIVRHPVPVRLSLEPAAA